MHIQYEMTVDDIVDAQIRSIRRSGVHQQWRVESAVYMAFISALLVLVLVRDPIVVAVFMAVAAGVLGAILQWFVYEGSMRKRMKKYVLEAYKGNAPKLFQVELRPDAIWTQSGYTQIVFDWRDVNEIVEDEEVIEFLMNGGYFLVRKARLSSATTAADFVALAKRYLLQSKSTTPPPVSGN
ncbi:MAG: hypothetical protein AMXMBFR84_11030 [Candidatus Hydrogenedentota bacterium]